MGAADGFGRFDFNQRAKEDKKTGLQVQFVAKDKLSVGSRFSLQLAAKITAAAAAQYCF